MSGHSHWAGIKYKKALLDSRRGKIFSKISRKITIAAKAAGADPDSNLDLRYALDEARSANMPKDNIARAINKGLGNLPGSTYERIVYEGYGPGGVAIMAEALTDNRNRTAGEIRKLFDRRGGNLGETNCVAWMFERKGVLTVESEDVDEDALLLAVMDAGAEDMETVGDFIEITTAVASFHIVKTALEKADFAVKMAQIRNIPKNVVELDAQLGRKVLGLIDALDDQDDVESVSANFSVPDEVMAELAAEA